MIIAVLRRTDVILYRYHHQSPPQWRQITYFRPLQPENVLLEIKVGQRVTERNWMETPNFATSFVAARSRSRGLS